MANYRGAFIVLEGGDRCGKSTQAVLIKQALTEMNVPNLSLKSPDRSSQTGKIIDQYLRKEIELENHVIHLLFSANRWESNDQIIKALSEGKIVVCDRYAFSGVVCTAAKGIPLEWCKQPDVGLVKPDLVLFFSVDPKKAETRGGFGDEIYETTEFQKRVQEQYSLIYDKEYFVTIDGGREKEVVNKDAIEAILKVQERVNAEKIPIKQLWV